jgi:hypothetical protein
MAHDVQADQIVDVPSWATSESVDISALAPAVGRVVVDETSV